jgi:hypothetical protein
MDISNPQQLQIALPDIKSLEDNFVERAQVHREEERRREEELCRHH